jgi:hypothetical protein
MKKFICQVIGRCKVLLYHILLKKWIFLIFFLTYRDEL